MPMSGCPPEEHLLSLAERRLEPAEMASLYAHLDQCADCRVVLAELLDAAVTDTAPEQAQSPKSPPSASAADKLPAQLDEYRLIRPIGHGSMGQVYLAYDTLLQRQVAIKWLVSVEPDAAAQARFLTEARAIARLHHPNVLSIYRIGQSGTRWYLISEFVHGRSLDKLTTPVPPQQAMAIAHGLAQALAVAHRHGILHRDIKPANAMLDETGEVKLLDFGLAKRLEGPARGPDSLPPLGDADLASETSLAMTGAGKIVGTPLYMAPEVWRGERATRRSDIYSLGALLYELCSGHPPYQGKTVGELGQAALAGGCQPLGELVPQVEPRFGTMVDRCLSLDPAARFASGDELCEALAALAAPQKSGPLPAGNPYRGLHPFAAADRALFFGRNAEVRAVVERLRAEPFVLVAGDSGVGKSSLCLAGVLPLVAEGGVESRATWSIIQVVLGRRPLLGLASALAAPLATTEAELLRRIKEEEPAALGRALRQQLGENGRLLLFVDQIEQLLTLAEPTEAAAIGQLLESLALGTSAVRWLATVRSDYLGRLALLPGLGREVQHALYLLNPLSPRGLREAIVGPAQAKGFRFESEAMVDELVAAASGGQGGLPLLQFALAELWEARDPVARLIPTSALAAIGQLSGALARHADDVLNHLLPAQRLVARHILRKLVTAEGTLTRRSESELVGPSGADPTSHETLQALVRGRLVFVCAAEAGQESAYQIAHEALLRSWHTLRGWLAKDIQSRATRQRLELAAQDWERLGRSRELLWRGPQLAELAAVDKAEYGPREVAFLQAARRAERWARIRRYAIIGVPCAFALSFWLAQRTIRNNQIALRLAESRSALLQARSLGTEVARARTAALGLFDAGSTDAGERAWKQLAPRVAIVEKHFVHASQVLESALLLDPTRGDVRALLTQTLYEWAVLADGERPLLKGEEILRHLDLYDDGSMRQRFAAAGKLGITSQPTGATVTLQRFVSDEQKKRQLEPPVLLGVTPIAARDIEQGSYVLTLAAPGRAPVVYPLLVGRSEPLRIQVDLPPAAAVPAGLIYIPEGQFLFGSGVDDEIRRTWFYAVPIHAIRTAPFLIARYETTFADWLEYLRALPEAEREIHLPRAENDGVRGGLRLAPTSDGGWQLTIQPTIQAYTARSGQPLQYPGRQRRSLQDWQHFPVAGISCEDAKTYALWLHQSGRVPGARLCSEQEWERAARGADDREFPHGDRLDPDDANYDETYGKQPLGFGPDEVGAHPSSRSPFELHDMTGNVWEWVLTAQQQCVLRGGAYYYGKRTNNVTNRQVAEPTARSLTIGMRICASVAR